MTLPTASAATSTASSSSLSCATAFAPPVRPNATANTSKVKASHTVTSRSTSTSASTSTSTSTSTSGANRRHVRSSGVMRECYGCRGEALVAALPSLRDAAREHATLVQTLRRERPSLDFPNLYSELFLNGFALVSTSASASMPTESESTMPTAYSFTLTTNAETGLVGEAGRADGPVPVRAEGFPVMSVARQDDACSPPLTTRSS